MVVSLDGESCILQCGDNEKVVKNRCACKESATQGQDGTVCVAHSACPRILLEDTDDEVCLNAQTCPKDLALKDDGKYCVGSCQEGIRMLVIGEYHCVSECPEGFARGRTGPATGSASASGAYFLTLRGIPA